jgi:hypothetical protein
MSCNHLADCLRCGSQVRALEARQDELERALEKMVRLFAPGRVYELREVSVLGSEAWHIATTALTRASN